MAPSVVDSYKAMAEGIYLLLKPHAEVVIHDLQTGRIAAIFGGLSQRRVGDESLLSTGYDAAQYPDVFPVMLFKTHDNRNVRSVSTTLRDAKGKAAGLLCINLDLSVWENMQHVLQQWLSGPTLTAQPKMLFEEDWRNQINEYVAAFLETRACKLPHLSKPDLRQLVQELHREGAFKAKNAAAYISRILEISRATVYKYLKESHETSSL